MNKRHRWATEIIAWAEGQKIECRVKVHPTNLWDNWEILSSPKWNTSDDFEYRIYNPFREVKEAHEAGKAIQSRFKNEEVWKDVQNPSWMPSKDYRIKPEPEYEPYTFEDAIKLIGKIVKSKEYPAIYTITAVTESSITVNNKVYSYGELMKYFEGFNGDILGKLKNS